MGVALVTGGGRGIEAGIAAELAAVGMNVAIASNESEPDAAAAIGTVRSSDRQAIYRLVDVSDIEGHRGLVDDIQAQLGPLTCLIINSLHRV